MRTRLPLMLAGYAGTVAVMGFFTLDAYGFGGCTPNTGPDVIVGGVDGISNYPQVGGFDAFSVGTTSCNIGSTNLLWQASNPNHPVIPQNMYRLKSVAGGARFEQVGQSWMKHAFTALTQNLCCTCNGSGGSVLGIGCSDPYTSGRNGTQITTVGGLGPKFQVNAHTGDFIWPYAFRNAAHIPHNSTTRRLQVRTSDLDFGLNPGAQYFVECHYVTPDDADNKNQDNNVSYRTCSISGGPTDFNATATGSTQREKPAIKAWKTADPGVVETNVATPEATNPTGGDNTGLVILSSQAYNIGGGNWRYEYACYNMNSDRSVSSFSIPLPAGAVVSNIGFHDVDYHSGDGFNSTSQVQGTLGYNYDGTDWPGVVSAGDITWSLIPASPVENSNALRWGTLYNFRFDCDLPPQSGEATLGMFKNVPGQPATAPGAAKVPGADCNSNNVADPIDISSGTSQDTNTNGIPDECEKPQGCDGDIVGAGEVNVDDLLAVINAWGSCANPNDCPADIFPAGGDDQVNVDDLLMVINHWGPCP